MKKTTLYVLLTLVIGAIAGFAVYEYYKQKKNKALVSPASTSGTQLAHQTFPGFNYNLILDSDTVQGVPEITALQTLINAYYAGQTSVPITGTWNAQTQAAVQQIEGKGSTNLYEFRYFYFDPKMGDAAATKIFQNLTTQA